MGVYLVIRPYTNPVYGLESKYSTCSPRCLWHCRRGDLPMHVDAETRHNRLRVRGLLLASLTKLDSKQASNCAALSAYSATIDTKRRVVVDQRDPNMEMDVRSIPVCLFLARTQCAFFLRIRADIGFWTKPHVRANK